MIKISVFVIWVILACGWSLLQISSIVVVTVAIFITAVEVFVRSTFIFSHKCKGRRDGKGYTSVWRTELSFFTCKFYNWRGEYSKNMFIVNIYNILKSIKKQKLKITCSSSTQIQPLLIFWCIYVHTLVFIHAPKHSAVLHKIF